MTGALPERRIVVGVDGSPGSEQALRWAIEQANLADASVEAVASWQDPVASAYYSFGFSPVVVDDEDWAALTGKYLQASVGRALEGLSSVRPVVTRVVQGHPAQVLLDAAAGARLLVVGTRGHGTPGDVERARALLTQTTHERLDHHQATDVTRAPAGRES